MSASLTAGHLYATEQRSVAKLTLLDRAVTAHHRDGWEYATDALAPLVTANGAGTQIDTQVDRRFGRFLAEARGKGQLPYRRPWVGIVHCPPSIPRWAQYRYSPSWFLRTSTWRAGEHHCRGLFTLSTRMARWLRERVDVPVSAVRHPTSEPSLLFDFDRFLNNPHRRILHIGWWLRCFASFYQLGVPPAGKAIVLPFVDNATRKRILPIIERDLRHHDAPRLENLGIELIDYQSNDSYDRLLANNIVFLHLYETVANNAILECIARHTPVLVNRLPDAVEYLGPSYPLYFDTLEEAALKAEDLGLIRKAHEYLRDMPKHDLSAESFRDAIANSEIYRRL